VRRKALVGLAVAGLAVGLPAAALATFTQVSKIVLTATKSGQSSGINANVHAKGTTPEQAKRLVATFPTGTTFRPGTVPACKLTNKQIESGKKCPKSSQIGTGSAVAKTIVGNVNAKVGAFASGNKNMVLVGTVTSPTTAYTVIRAVTSKNVLNVGPIPNKASGLPITLTSLKVNLPKRGTGNHALVTAGKCVNHKFTVTSAFTYYSGSPVMTSSSSSCTG